LKNHRTMEKKIQSFLDAEKNLTFCTSNANEPYCASCFYAFDRDENILIFKSERMTQHIVNALLNDKVAGTITPDIHKTGTIKGIQFTGKFIMFDKDRLDKAQHTYYFKFPFALVIPGELWGIELLSVKMTDNTLGFGRKMVWEKFPVETVSASSAEVH
jgi:uncharacterized protein